MNYNVSFEQVNLTHTAHINSFKRFAIRGVILGILIAIISGIASSLDRHSDSNLIGILWFIIVAALFLVIAYYFVQIFISFYKFHYKCWETIQDDGYAMVTPSKAAGYLFIPIFNLYWLFISFYGLANQVNQYIDRHRLDDRLKTKSGQTLAFCIFCIVPFVGWAINLFLYFIVIADFKKSCSYLAQSKTERPVQNATTLAT